MIANETKWFSKRDQMTQKLTTPGQRNCDCKLDNSSEDDQSSYPIVSYNRSRNDKSKTIHTRKLSA